MDRVRARRARRELVDLSCSGLEWSTLALKAGALLRSVVPFEHACWHSIDPASQLLTGAVKDNLADDPRHVRYEVSVDDVNKFSYLARAPQHVGILSRATHGHLGQSPRYRELLQPVGIGWELRAAFVTGDAPWGACGIYRSPDERDFDEAEAAFVASMSTLLAEGFRRSLLLDRRTVAGGPDAPGLVLLDELDRTVSITATAVHWLQELVDVGPRPNPSLPAPVYAVAARARQLAADPGAAPLRARVRAFTRAGQWLLLHAAQLDGSASGLTAIIVEPARPADVVTLVLQAYGLSEREQDVTQFVLRGLSTKDIARELSLSPLTVQHYMKTIFQKLAVRSRGELMAKVLLQDRPTWAPSS